MSDSHALAPAPVTTVPRRSSRGGLLLGLAGLVAVAGLAFAGGRLTAPATAAGVGAAPTGPAPGASFVPGADGGAGGPLGAGSMTVTGTVTAISGDTMTIETADGGSVQVGLSGTTYHAQAGATAADLAAGTEVRVEVDGAGAPPAGASPAAGATPAPRALTATDVTVVTK